MKPPMRKQRHSILLTGALVLADIITLVTAFWVAYLVRFVLLPYYSIYSWQQYALMISFTVPMWLAIFIAYQLYSPQLLFGGMQEYARLFSAVTIGMLGVIGVDYIARSATMISRGWLVLAWALSLGLLLLERFCFRRVIYSLRRRGHLLAPAIIVGVNTEGAALAQQLDHWSTSGLDILGYVGKKSEPGATVDELAIIGSLDQLEAVITDNQVQDVIVAPTALERIELLQVFQTVTRMENVRLWLSSGLFEIISSGLRVRELAYVPLVEVSKTRITGMDAFMKSVVDYGVSTAFILLTWPLLALLALLVKLDSPGPVIYRRRVMGVNGVEFDAYKFRTMHIHGDQMLADHPELQTELAQNYKLKDDPRVTRFGKLLRKFSLDELPQMFNILAGQMSLVGPRMISPPEMEKYGKWGMNLLTVKPGITGLWQVSGRSDVSYEERVRLDMQYIRNWNIWQDLYIILMTFPAVLKRRGAY